MYQFDRQISKLPLKSVKLVTREIPLRIRDTSCHLILPRAPRRRQRISFFPGREGVYKLGDSAGLWFSYLKGLLQQPFLTRAVMTVDLTIGSSEQVGVGGELVL